MPELNKHLQSELFALEYREISCVEGQNRPSYETDHKTEKFPMLLDLGPLIKQFIKSSHKSRPDAQVHAGLIGPIQGSEKLLRT